MICNGLVVAVLFATGFVVILTCVTMLIRWSVIDQEKADKLNYQGFVKYVNLMREEGVPISEKIERNIDENKHLAG